MSATHAISKIEQKSQNRILRELLDSLSQFHFFEMKKSLTEKSYVDFLSWNSTYVCKSCLESFHVPNPINLA